MALKPILIIPDTHIPYHNTRAWDLVLNVGTELKPHHLVIIGDLADFYSVSSHLKDPRRADDLEWEVAETNVALDQLDALGAPHKYYIEGNHEDRLSRYLSDKAPELFGVVNIRQLFNLTERGYVFTPYKHHNKIGKLHITHDVGTAGRYAAHRALDTYQHSILTGHTHRLQYVVEGNAIGEFKLSAQFGWLGDADKIDYMHRAKVNKDWALGFGMGYIDDKTGIAYLVPVPIIKVNRELTCMVNGKLYRN